MGIKARTVPEQVAIFLRGMNLGRRRISNQALCSAAQSMGCHDISAFLASGNLICRSPSVDDIESFFETGLSSTLGYPVPSFLRRAQELRAIATRSPFSPIELESHGKAQVILLKAALPAAQRAQIAAMASPEDLLVVDAREIYWLPRAGVSQSNLDLAGLSRLTGPNTMRTMRTIERMVHKFF